MDLHLTEEEAHLLIRVLEEAAEGANGDGAWHYQCGDDYRADQCRREAFQVGALAERIREAKAKL